MAYQTTYTTSAHCYGCLFGAGSPHTCNRLNQEEKVGLLKKVKELAMSGDDKVLRKQGFLSECGDLTEEGKTVLLNCIFEEYKSDLVDLAKKLEAEDKKKKK